MSPVEITSWEAWQQRATSVLSPNVSRVDGYRYTHTSPMAVGHQSLWDSCFHSMIWRWLDPDMARDELLGLFAYQITTGPDSGMIPHRIYWQADASSPWANAAHSLITHPPLIASACLRLYDFTDDLSFLGQVYPRLEAYHEWFDRRRDPDGDHLVSIIHPWESGWDASQRWDAPMGLTNPQPAEAALAWTELIQVIVAFDCDAVTLAEAGYFHVEAIDFNAIRAADLEAMTQIAELLNQRVDADMWRAKALAVQKAVQTKLFREQPHDLEGLDELPIRVESASDFVAMFGGCVSQQQAVALVERLKRHGNWPTHPVPTVPTTDRLFRPDEYWRGNTWMPVNWLIYQGLRRYGYHQLATDLALKALKLVWLSGFAEYYDPIVGSGYGAKDASWSALVLDMLACELKDRGQL